MTSFASSWRAMASTSRRAFSGSASSSVRTRYFPERTSETDAKPRAWRPLRMVRPAGSLTTGFRVMKTSALTMHPRERWLGGQPAQRLQVPLGRPGNDLVRKRWSRRLLVPAKTLEIVADVLLVEGGLRTARPVLLDVPEAGGVGGHHLVDEDDLAVEAAELELGVGEDDAGLERTLVTKAVELEAEPLERCRQLASRTIGQLGPGDVLIVAGGRLGGRCEDRLRQSIALVQASRQALAGDGAASLVILPPGARDVATHDALEHDRLGRHHPHAPLGEVWELAP